MPRKNSWTQKSIKDKFDSVKLRQIEPLGKASIMRTKWKCECSLCGSIVMRSLESLISTGTEVGCQKCSARIRNVAGRVKTEEVERIVKNLDLVLLSEYEGISKPMTLRCNRCGREFSRTLSSLKSSVRKWNIEIGCPYCTNNRKSEDEQSAILKSIGLEPLEPYFRNSQRRLYKCIKCGSETRQTWMNITRKIRLGAKSYGCPSCSFSSMGRRYSEDPEVARQRFREAGLILTGDYQNARNYIDCICVKCGEKTKQSLNGVNNGKTCKYCSPKGIQLSSPSYVYFIEHKQLPAWKVGVGNSNNKNDRLKIHENNGWVLLKKWDVERGDQAIAVESAFFLWLRKELKIPPYMSRGDMKQRGWSETFTSQAISKEEVADRIAKLLAKVVS